MQIASHLLFVAKPADPQDSWSRPTSIIYITISQIMNGIAKDLTKLGGKTVTKLVTPEEKQVMGCL